MIARSTAWDCITRKKLELLRCLKDRELAVNEIQFMTSQSRSSIFYNLNLLEREGLVEKKKALKKNHWQRSKKPNREIVRFILTSNGAAALEYFSIGRN